jgi:hypothetical protein
MTLYGSCRNGLAGDEIEYAYLDPYVDYWGPREASFQRCLTPGTYFLNVGSYAGSIDNHDYAVLIEEEKDPAVAADAGKNSCMKPSGKKTEISLDGSATRRFAYQEEEDSAPFIDITSTGNEVMPGLSAGLWAVIVFPEDFSFRFFGCERKRVVMSCDGYLSFGSLWHDFFSWGAPFFSPDLPNDIAAPFWGTHFDKSDGGKEFYEFRDVDADSKKDLVVEWDDLILGGVGLDDHYTFEAILYYGSDKIEFRYQAAPVHSPEGYYAEGLKDYSGLRGIRHKDVVASGESLMYSWVPVPLPETSMTHYNLVKKPGPIFDIALTGTKMVLGDDNSSEITPPSGFAFNFYGNQETKLLKRVSDFRAVGKRPKSGFDSGCEGAECDHCSPLGGSRSWNGRLRLL